MDRKRTFNEMMLLAAMHAGKLDRDIRKWPNDADFWRGLSRLAKATAHSIDRFWSVTDQEQFLWWEQCLDGKKCLDRAYEILESLVALGLVGKE